MSLPVHSVLLTSLDERVSVEGDVTLGTLIEARGTLWQVKQLDDEWVKGKLRDYWVAYPTEPILRPVVPLVKQEVLAL